MQRIVKRFLLHRDRDSDDVNEMDFDELKQDLQMIRYEMNNDLKKSRDETTRILKHVNSGLLLLGEQVFKDCRSNDLLDRYHKYKSTKFISSLGYFIKTLLFLLFTKFFISLCYLPCIIVAKK